MKKAYSSLLSAFFVIIIIYWVFYCMMPQNIEKPENNSQFSTENALKIVKKIAEKPHYIGSTNHNQVANYLVSELKKLGLEVTIQEGFAINEGNILAKPKNILAKIKGTTTNKALMLLAHYDSAPHSKSLGASDDASGVATIIESVRAFLESKTAHKNDIIILFSDAEEIGLNGAALFAKQHPWAKNIGLILNFEARGSSGPSYMLMETNNGNAALVDGFAKANPEFPVSNSLMYSIYKMLPNDTDLTVFRENNNIQGLNFAFIDSHFNYHTAQDDFSNLSQTTLAHQASYLMPLLRYFSDVDLLKLKTNNDNIYFNTPFSFVSYPFEWVLPMCCLAFVMFLVLVFFGIAKHVLSIPEIIKGFLPLLLSLFLAGFVVFLGWKAVLKLYPENTEILHGFTYNGHDYLAAFIFLSLTICFFIYEKTANKKAVMSHSIAPIFVWMILNFAIAFSLKGAGFMIIPIVFILIGLAYFIITEKQNWIINLLFSIPTLIIIVPLIKLFPIGLGLKIVFVAALLTVLCYYLLIAVFGSYSKKGIWSFVFLLLSITFLIKAHINSGFSPSKAKPNSMVYVLDTNKNKAFWATYDEKLDDWTKFYLGNNPKKFNVLENFPLFSKYNSGFTYSAEAPIYEISGSQIDFLKDSIGVTKRFLKIKISPQRKVNRYDVFANPNLFLNNFKANGIAVNIDRKKLIKQKGNQVLRYYVVNNEPLEIEFNIKNADVLDMEFLESSFDLLAQKSFRLAKRTSSMIPKPFVLNDAVIIKQKIKPTVSKDTIRIVKPIALIPQQ
jgi:hypothetical protein